MVKNRNASLDLAWEYYLQGFRLHWLATPETNREAREMFVKASKIRPDFARAYAHLSFTLLVAWLNGWDSAPGTKNSKVSLKKIVQYAEQAVEVGGDDYDNLWSLGLAYVYSGRHDEAVKVYNTAIKNAKAQGAAAINVHAIRIDLADALMFAGEPEEESVRKAIDIANKALTAGPTPQRWFKWTLGWCYYEAGFYGNEEENCLKAHEALSSFRRPDTLATKALVAVKVALGREDEARKLAFDFMNTDANSGYDIELERRWPYRNEKRRERYMNHLQRAGLKK
jgi:tetratricopeptide (TPR) repeat protein